MRIDSWVGIGLAVVLALLVGAALAGCSFDGRGLPDAGASAQGGHAGAASTVGGSGGDGGGDGGQAGARNEPADAGPDGPLDARMAIDSSAPCLVGMAALACAPEGLACSQEDPTVCALVRCACVAGFWACSSTPHACGDPQPPPRP